MWHKEYLSICNTDVECIPKTVFDEIQEGITSLQSEKPLVSVVLIAYNEERQLPACLLSIARQKCKYPIEIIGIDNASNDRTAEIYQNAGVIYFREDKKGTGNARQCGLDNSRGKYHVCIDSDSIYPPTYIEYVINILEKRKKVVAVNANYGLLSNNHSPFMISFYLFFRNFYSRILKINRPELAARGAVFSYKIEPVRDIGYRTNIYRGEDGGMAFELKAFGKIVFNYNKKCRAMTSFRSVDGNHSLISILKFQSKKHLKSIGNLFTKQKGGLIDQPDNIIKNI